MCEALNLIPIPARKKKKDTKTQTNRKPQTLQDIQTPNRKLRKCILLCRMNVEFKMFLHIQNEEERCWATRLKQLQNTRRGGALFVDKVYFRFNLLQLYKSGPLAQINGRCTELVAGRGWRHTCLMTPSRLYSGLGASKGVVWNSLIHVATLALGFVKGRFIMTSERKQVAIFLSKAQKGPLTVPFTSN